MKLKHEKDLDSSFADRITQIPGCENLRDCIQCGVCSGTCPLLNYMDESPRQIINMIRAGFKDEVLSSLTPWICASCYSCSAECPQEIEITNIMYAVKRMGMGEDAYPKASLVPSMARIFEQQIENMGRISEILTLLYPKLSVEPFSLPRFFSLGWNMFKSGRIKLLPDTMEGKEEIKTMLVNLKGKS